MTVYNVKDRRVHVKHPNGNCTLCGKSLKREKPDWIHVNAMFLSCQLCCRLVMKARHRALLSSLEESGVCLRPLNSINRAIVVVHELGPEPPHERPLE